jgi:hypothetical protein
MLPHENSKDKVEKYIVTIGMGADGLLIKEEVVACKMKFAIKDWFAISFLDREERLVKEYFMEILAVEPIYSVEE